MRTYLWAGVGILTLACGATNEAGDTTVGTSAEADSFNGHGNGRDDDRGVDDGHRHGWGFGHGHDGCRRSCDRETSPLARGSCEQKLLIGAAADAGPLAADAVYAQTLAAEFSSVTPGNEMKWGSVQPVDATHWDFTGADNIVAAAQAADQEIKGHTLIWHQQLPGWVNDSLSAAALQQAINNNIDTLVGRYRGKVRAWDVVNEAMNDDGTLRDSVFSRKFGVDFIANAFKRAHKADKKAKLFYNDYGIEVANAKSDAVYNLVKSLKQAGVPIDGVGFQFHVDARFAPSMDAMLANFKRFAKLGLSVNVSELDVQVRNLTGTRAEKLAVQKQIYHRVVTACALTEACESLTTWGFTDKYSWIDSTFGPDDPLELDESYGRKPAYYAMVDALAGVAPDPAGAKPNLIPNSAFEAGTDGWFGFGIPSVATGKREHTGELSLVAAGRTDTWQGPGTNVTGLVQAGWSYNASAFVSIRGAKTDTAKLSAKITCEGADPTFVNIATGAVQRREYTELAGVLQLPMCNLTEVLVYAEGPAAGVDLLIDDVSLRPLSEPLGPNIVANGTFESGVSGWIAWAGTLAPSTVAHTGTGSVIVTNRTDTWQGPVTELLPAATIGATYLIDGFARIEGAASATVNITVASTCDGSQTFTPVGTATANDAGFVEVTGSYLVPACNNLTQLSMYFEGPAAGVNLIVDDVTVRQRLSIPIVEPPPPPAAMNLMGNGGFELGAAGWFGFGTSVAATAAFVHSGAAAGVGAPRTDTWQGPAVNFPSGPGTYDVSVFALQNSGADVNIALSTKLTCNGADQFGTINNGNAATGTWKELAGTLTIPAGCTGAVIYLQQFGGSVFPDLYVDDLVVKPVAVTNLSGNPGFETGTGGWFAYGTGISQTAAFVHGGAAAGVSSGRSADWMGPAFAYPTGAGQYSASVYALQNSGADLPFILTAKTTCNGADSYPTVAVANGPSGAWVNLAGNFTVPAGCTAVELFLHQNGGSSFPDIYVDDLVALPLP